ncbi:MAG: DUF2085 domain-containing protein [Chloroflexota bacterium]|nr:DUF2085 domain-containing protein [Chloroflexota bacterium]
MIESKKPDPAKSPWRWVVLGIAIILTVIWLLLTPEGLLGKAGAVGYAVCHQISSRTFHFGGYPLPLCARCSGMFLGALLGLGYQIVQGRKGKMPPKLVLIFFGLLAAAWVFDGSNSFFMMIPEISSLYKTQNWTRLITGTGMGLAVSALLLPSFIQTMFIRWEDESALGNWKQVLGLIAAAVGMDILILLEIPWLLYPLSLLSTASIFVLLIMVYSMVLVMVFKKENIYDRINQLFMPLLGGYIFALLQIGAIDFLRYLWMGTWEGFNLF